MLWSAPDSEAKKCCMDGNDEMNKHSDIGKSCECSIETQCAEGNGEMCDISMEYCCPTKDMFERSECEQNVFDTKCPASIEEGSVDEYGQYSFCHDSAESKCQDDKDADGCKCAFWESLCKQYPQKAVCEDAVTSCCSSRSTTW